MASHLPPGEDHVPNPHVSASRWRHQESSAYHKAAAPRDPHTASANTRDLSNFFNSTRVERSSTNGSATANFTPIMIGTSDGAHSLGAPAAAPGGLEVICGPLLNYRRMDGNLWVGSALIVTAGGGKAPGSTVPVLNIGRVETVPGADGVDAPQPSGIQSNHGAQVGGQCLYSDPRCTFWAFPLVCDMAPTTQTKWAYSVTDVSYRNADKPKTNYFYIPAVSESMRIMFHSCNGFSVGTDEEAFSGPALWNDVMRVHAEEPFHVMIGGGDQIYNDGIRVNGPLREWTDIGNPKKRRDYPFPEDMRQRCDDYYLNNYLAWYDTGAFASANGQIPQLNIWDDHDIIDGFGSYVHEFMKCDVFRGIGGVAHKYYLLFQHHMPPPVSTYTTDAPQTTTADAPDHDVAQLKDTFVAPQGAYDASYIVGHRPGPYVAHHSLNMFSKLGARIAYVGLDARMERTRHQVNYPETYDLIFDRIRSEFTAAAESGEPYRHLMLLLGVPIAYPRLTWLENIFSSPMIAPIKFLNRRFGFGGGVFNQFDGNVDLLDDLDDHYTARTHKKERNALIERLQGVCADFSVRCTILSGDVHLAAFGRFYSNPNLHIPTEADHRYITNVVSSAITNKPPPNAVANLLASRNKIHHMNPDTDESLLDMFDKDPGTSNRTMNSNHCTMPSRNYAILTENSPNAAATNGHANGTDGTNGEEATNAFDGKTGHQFLHKGEVDSGTKHIAADAVTHGKRNDGSIDCCIRIEMDQHDREGHTEGYGLTIPALNYEAGKYGTNIHSHRLHMHHRSRPGTSTTGYRTSGDRAASLTPPPPVPGVAGARPASGPAGH